ncbi:hypothetical protein GCM10027051_03310 [Niabella terrae]
MLAQETGLVKGIVTDEKGQPAEKVTIGVSENARFTVTDAQGQYELRLPAGQYKLTTSRVGYESQHAEIRIPAGQTIILNIRIRKSKQEDLEEVTVATMTKKRSLETQGFAVAIIDTKEASLRNLTTNELLDRTVGVRVRQNGGEGAPIEYNLNGMSGSTIGLFLDGIEISTYGSSFNLNNIPPAMIERIEVYKGVLPAHLSGNYIGGAINVVMKKDASANNIAASLSYGSFNSYRADLSALYRNSQNGLTARASGFFSHSDNNYEMWGKFSK